MTTTDFPPLPGTYALVLQLSQAADIEVGKRGTFQFPSGYYIYIGSALGPGGLAARLRRHSRSTADPGWKNRWHIDYLRHYTKTVGVWALQRSARQECLWAAWIHSLPGVSIPVPGFGSSDCCCPAHLFHFDRRPRPHDLTPLISEQNPGDKLWIFESPAAI